MFVGMHLRVFSLPVGIGLGRNLWDICCLAHPSRNFHLFINCFYEDYMDCTCSSSLLNICSGFTSHDLMSVQQHSLPPALEAHGIQQGAAGDTVRTRHSTEPL